LFIFRVSKGDFLELKDSVESVGSNGIFFGFDQRLSVNDSKDPGSSCFAVINLLNARNDLIQTDSWHLQSIEYFKCDCSRIRTAIEFRGAEGSSKNALGTIPKT